MKKITALFYLFISIYSSKILAQPVSFDWAHRVGPGIEGIGNSSVTDASGNIYTVGSFTGYAYFGSGTARSIGKKDFFVEKRAPNGIVTWVKSFGGKGNDVAKSVCLANSYLYIVGTFDSAVTFSSNPIVPYGQNDAFILKLSTSTGMYSGGRRIGGYGNDEASCISNAGNGKLCITGSFQGTADLNPNISLISDFVSEGGSDIFVEVINTNLELIWAKTAGGGGNDYGNNVSADQTGNIYTTGSFEYSADANPDSLVYQLISHGASDIFVQKLDANGSFLWANNIGDFGNDEGKCIKTDLQDNVYILGNFSGNPDFDPTINSYHLLSEGGTDIFMLKLNSTGNFINAFSEGGASDENGNGFVIDASKNIYLTGTFQDSLDFDPGAGILNITSIGLNDMFIQKFDSTFNHVFTKCLQNVSDGTSCAITIDPTGNIYSAGSFSGTTDFDPDSPIANKYAVDGHNYYIHKLNSSGVFQWAKTVISNGELHTRAITTDKYGNSYSTGYFYNSVDFDPGPGTFMLEAKRGDSFIRKLDASGNLTWAVSLESLSGVIGSWGSRAADITVDSMGNVYVLGNFKEEVDFDPSSNTFIITPISYYDELFIEKLDSDGNFLWAKALQQNSNPSYTTEPKKIIVDNTGAIYISGSFTGIMDFDPSLSVHPLTSYSYSNPDAFIGKYSSAGDLLWVKKIGISNSIDVFSYSFVTGMALDASKNIIISVMFGVTPNDSIIIEPGSINITNQFTDGIIKFDNNGNYIWIKGFPPSLQGNIKITSLKLDKLNNIYYTGMFSGTIDFNPDTSVYYMSSSSSANDNIFIEKLDSTANFVWAKAIGGPNSDYSNDIYLDNFNNVYITGTYHSPMDFDPGPSVFTLSTLSYDAFIEKLNSNGDFVWAQATTTAAIGGATGVSIAVDYNNNVYIAGSLLSSLMDLDPTAGSYQVVPAGNVDGFVIKLNQCVVNSILPAQVSCNDYTFNGNIYSNSGTYGELLGTSSHGCDSTVTFDVIVNGPITTVTQNGNYFTANQSGAAYQWLDCNSSNLINNANAQSMAVSQSGSFAVEITLNGCTDTSDCIPFIAAGIPSSNTTDVKIYPLPFSTEFTLEYNTNSKPTKMYIINTLGELVFEQIIQTDLKQIIRLEGLPSGIYSLRVENDYSSIQKNIIKVN
ncbi:MAG: SBBP repeat-containing protein [Bacteroidia bacterium]